MTVTKLKVRKDTIQKLRFFSQMRNTIATRQGVHDYNMDNHYNGWVAIGVMLPSNWAAKEPRHTGGRFIARGTIRNVSLIELDVYLINLHLDVMI